MLIMTPRFIFLAATIIIILVLISVFVVTNIKISGVELDIFNQRLLTSPNGLSYYDPLSNRVYPGIIDINNFNSEELLNDRIIYKDPQIASKIILIDKSSNKQSTAYYNKNQFENWNPLTVAQGPGGADNSMLNMYVIIREKDGSFNKGFLSIESVMLRG